MLRLAPFTVYRANPSGTGVGKPAEGFCALDAGEGRPMLKCEALRAWSVSRLRTLWEMSDYRGEYY